MRTTAIALTIAAAIGFAGAARAEWLTPDQLQFMGLCTPQIPPDPGCRDRMNKAEGEAIRRYQESHAPPKAAVIPPPAAVDPPRPVRGFDI
jgi:hypothetical protein